MDASALHQRGRDAWPGIEVALDDFAVYLAEREADAERASELYLACACARGDAVAVARFEQVYFPDVRGALARVTREYAVADEALQLLRYKLFVPGDRPAEISGYAGRGDLAGWLRVVATRIALGLLRARRVDVDVAELAELPSPEADPELALLRRRHAADANAAIRTAFAELSVRERNLLRQHYIDRLGIDALAALYGVHRATSARWINAALAAMERRARALLVERLGISESSADSLVATLRSDLHISLSGEG